ncbi:hypothetical protein L1987_19151 [Smallanthus sonchifolius]|uniref:Uncharacterized protein n=1 Tax=Smallanthus sonchifolius TaxID=185202 RepID=A0ACB9J3V4_9ASTR|nr:hypothetical protein L1987_19151 [Smallanthus sonchifolius]
MPGFKLGSKHMDQVFAHLSTDFLHAHLLRLLQRIAMAMTANTNSTPGFRLFAQNKCSLQMRNKKLKFMNFISNSYMITSFLDVEWYARMVCSSFMNQKQIKLSKSIVNELGGQHEEVFNDVKLELRNYFTAKAVRTVLYQLYEMNPPRYIWLHKLNKL